MSRVRPPRAALSVEDFSGHPGYNWWAVLRATTHDSQRPTTVQETRTRVVLARIATVFLTGLLAGAMFEEYLLLKVVLHELPSDQWVGLHARFGLVHPFTLIPIAALATVTLALVLAFERDASLDRRAIARHGGA